MLESFHWTSNNPDVVKAAWPHLGNEDRNLRFAACVALETVSANQWKDQALKEAGPAKAIIAWRASAARKPTKNSFRR